MATPAGTTDPVSSNNSSTDTDSNLFDMISVCTGTALVKAGDFTSSPVASSTGWYMANSPFDTPISNVYNYTGTSAYRNSDMTGGLFDMVMVDAELLTSESEAWREALTMPIAGRTGRGRNAASMAEHEIIATNVDTEIQVMAMIDTDILLAQGDLFSAPKRLRDDRPSAAKA